MDPSRNETSFGRGRGRGRGYGRGRGRERSRPIRGDESSVNQMAQLNIEMKEPVRGNAPMRPPLSKGPGSAGSVISVSVNHFPVRIRSAILYHYDVDVKACPPAPSPVQPWLLKQVIEDLITKVGPLVTSCPVYDGKRNIYTVRKMTGVDSKREINYTLVGDEGCPLKQFQVTIQPTGDMEVDLATLEAYCDRTGKASSTDIPQRPIQVLDLALKYGARRRRVIIGQSLMKPPEGGRVEDLGGGVEMWFGHFQSLRLGWKPFLNVDSTQRAFLKSHGRVHEIMAETYRSQIGAALTPAETHQFSRLLDTVKVSYPRGGYSVKIGCNGLRGAANAETFQCQGKQVTVQQYFEEKYQLVLRYPHLPCLWVGSKDRNNYVPMELCSIVPGQEYRRKLTDVQTSKMIRKAAVPPSVRKQRILQSLRDMKLNQDVYADQFGVEVQPEMLQLHARVIPTPQMLYGQGRSVTPTGGVWTMAGAQLLDTRPVSNYGVLDLSGRLNPGQIHLFIRALERAGRSIGIQFGTSLFTRQCPVHSTEDTMMRLVHQFPSLQLLFVFISNGQGYHIVKSVGDLKLKLVTQCLAAPTILGRNNQGPDFNTLVNICLKINTKLGGVNTVLTVTSRPSLLPQNEQVMIMGADVTHPSPGSNPSERMRHSIAAVVGSLDPGASRYCAEMRLQKPRQETIQDMEDMVHAILMRFYRTNCRTSTGKPQRIIFYRDGVSEGQFAQVLDKEMAAIRRACTRLERGYQPLITFLVVQKRHHTRMFPDSPTDGVGRSGNVPPGTVIDTHIVHPTETDFFLVSHFGVQGTSRPTHYHLLWDDSNASADELQQLTYYLCYLFARCTRAVSYPAPCYYSHLVAYRGRQYYEQRTRTQTNLNTRDLQADMSATCRQLDHMFFV